jgi:fluoroacetyl-CoA thioesterase
MDAREIITVGMSAERIITVRPDLTVKHFVPKMPAVFATPMMIMEMEMASADAIAPCLAAGWVTVGTEVDIRHLGASAVGAKVRTTARVIAVERRVIRFEVEAYEGADTRAGWSMSPVSRSGWAGSRHCERSEAIQSDRTKTGLLRRKCSSQ